MHLPRNTAFTLLSALLASCALIQPAWWALVVPGLALFLYALWFETKTLPQALWQGLIFGFVTAGAGIFWFWDTLPITWLADDAVTQVVAVGIIWALISLFLGLGTLLVTPLLFWLRSFMQRPYSAVLLPTAVALLWSAQEYLRMLFYGFITLGGESLSGAHFSVSALAYALAEHQYLLQYAYPFGIYSLSAALGIFAAAGALGTSALIERKFRNALAVISVVLATLLIPVLFLSHKETPLSSLRVALVTLDGNPESYRDDVMNTLLDDIARAAPDIVVLPESTTPPWLLHDSDIRRTLNEKLENRDVLFVYSSYNVAATEESSAELVYEHVLTGERVTYHKRLLMPLGEYIPSFTKTAFGLLSNETLQARINNLSGLLKRGDTPAPTVTVGGRTLGALLCSENLSPVLYRDLSHKGADTLINLANITWFHNSPRVMHLLHTLGKVHAVQNRAPFLLAAKGGYSFVLNSRGEVVAKSAANQNSVLVYELNSR